MNYFPKITISPLKEGRFFGLTTDGNHRFLLEDNTGGVLQFEVGIKSKIPTVAFTTEFKGAKIPTNIPDNQFSSELFSSNQFTLDSSSLTFDDGTG